jgi:hypothetical protein
MALDAGAELLRDFLDSTLDQVGNVWRGRSFCVSLSVDQPPHRSEAIGDLVRESPSSKIVESSEDAARRINIDLSSRLVLFVMDVAAIIVSVVFAISISAQWDTYLRFRYGGSFGVADPLFKVDLGFYFFRLPFYELCRGASSF